MNITRRQYNAARRNLERALALIVRGNSTGSQKDILAAAIQAEKSIQTIKEWSRNGQN